MLIHKWTIQRKTHGQLVKKQTLTTSAWNAWPAHKHSPLLKLKSGSSFVLVMPKPATLTLFCTPTRMLRAPRLRWIKFSFSIYAIASAICAKAEVERNGFNNTKKEQRGEKVNDCVEKGG